MLTALNISLLRVSNVHFFEHSVLQLLKYNFKCKIVDQSFLRNCSNLSAMLS